MRKLLPLSVLILAVSSPGCQRGLGVPPPATPNILLIVGDDLSTTYVSAYGAAASPSTPTIDSLAAGGLRFTQAWANPSCSPTRAGFFTGQHAWRHGIGHPASNKSGLSAANSLPNVLLGAGYRSALFGKWHLDTAESPSGASGTSQSTRLPNLYDFGWHTFIGTVGGRVEDSAGAHDYWNWLRFELEASAPATAITAGDAATWADSNTYVTTDTVGDAGDWITGHSDMPWFVTMAFNAPHDPFHSPSDPLQNGATCLLATDLDCYVEMVQSLDTHISLLLTKLTLLRYDDGSSVYDHSVILFIGDNGSPLGMEATPLVPSICSAGTEPCHKTTVFEGGIRVPFIISGPEGVDAALAGTTHDGPVHTTDLYETVLDYAGAAVPGDYDEDSFSLHALAHGGAAPARNFLITEQFMGNDPSNANSSLRVAILEPAGGVVNKVQCDLSRTDQTTLYDIGSPPAPDYEETVLATTPNAGGTAEEQTLDRLLAEIAVQRGGLGCP